MVSVKVVTISLETMTPMMKMGTMNKVTTKKASIEQTYTKMEHDIMRKVSISRDMMKKVSINEVLIKRV